MRKTRVAALVAATLALSLSAAVSAETKTQSTTESADILTQKADMKTWRPSCGGKNCSASGVGY